MSEHKNQNQCECLDDLLLFCLNVRHKGQVNLRKTQNIKGFKLEILNSEKKMVQSMNRREAGKYHVLALQTGVTVCWEI